MKTFIFLDLDQKPLDRPAHRAKNWDAIIEIAENINKSINDPYKKIRFINAMYASLEK